MTICALDACVHRVGILGALPARGLLSPAKESFQAVLILNGLKRCQKQAIPAAGKSDILNYRENLHNER